MNHSSATQVYQAQNIAAPTASCLWRPRSASRSTRTRRPQGVISGWNSAAMAWSVGAEPIPSSIISRRRRQPGSSRWPRQSNGMWAAPPSDHFREIDWSVPSRWKTLRTSDELLHSRQLADGGRTCRRAKSARRAKLEQHTERPMYVSKSPAETWEGLLRTHRRTARLSIWLVHFGPWTTRRKLLCIARTPSRWARGLA